MRTTTPARRRNAGRTARQSSFRRGGPSPARDSDGAGVREIAAAPVVTAMLVNRYFGSKAVVAEFSRNVGHADYS